MLRTYFRWFIIGALYLNICLAATVTQAFKQFYNDPSIDPIKCGVNIQHFLRYLNQKHIPYSEGYVVSVHEPFAYLNHFDARWGRSESYPSNGQAYKRDNWYFHVFVVIDGIAYDFSQAGSKTLSVQDYLNLAYLPKYPTKNVFLQGVLTEQSELKKYSKMQMKLYDLDDYRESFGPARYEGKFIELFK